MALRVPDCDLGWLTSGACRLDGQMRRQQRTQSLQAVDHISDHGVDGVGKDQADTWCGPEGNELGQLVAPKVQLVVSGNLHPQHVFASAVDEVWRGTAGAAARLGVNDYRA